MKYYKVNENGEIEGVAIDRKFISRSEAEEMFPNQPERSKREDCICATMKRYTMSGIYQGEYKRCKCGALNTDESQ